MLTAPSVSEGAPALTLGAVIVPIIRYRTYEMDYLANLSACAPGSNGAVSVTNTNLGTRLRQGQP